jgi:hypothetical protein
MPAARETLKRISVDELKVGMFIVNLGRSWLAHPFLRNQFAVTSPNQIKKLKKSGIKEVYIDPRRGLDLPPRGKLEAPEEPHLYDELRPISDGTSPSFERPTSAERNWPRLSFNHRKIRFMAYWQENVESGGEPAFQDAPFEFPMTTTFPTP